MPECPVTVPLHECPDWYDKFALLFAGRADAWGAVHGQSMKSPIDAYRWKWHLEQGSIGIYPLVHRRDLSPDDLLAVESDERCSGEQWGNWFVRWGCTDIDKGYEASWPMALNLYLCLSELGLHPWIERSKGKGFHVWLFATRWVPAEVMRRALLAAHQLVEVPPTEVNPKQTNLGGALSYGNYVNLPYPSGYFGLNARVVLSDLRDHNIDHYYDAERFTEQAWRNRNNFPQLYEAAKLYVPPPPVERVVVGEYDGSLEPLVRKMDGLTYTIFRDGPYGEQDRSSALQRFVHKLAEGGKHTPSQAKALLMDADARWGKFSERPNADRYYDAMIGVAEWTTRD